VIVNISPIRYRLLSWSFACEMFFVHEKQTCIFHRMRQDRIMNYATTLCIWNARSILYGIQQNCYKLLDILCLLLSLGNTWWFVGIVCCQRHVTLTLLYYRGCLSMEHCELFRRAFILSLLILTLCMFASTTHPVKCYRRISGSCCQFEPCLCVRWLTMNPIDDEESFNCRWRWKQNLCRVCSLLLPVL